MKPVKTNKEAYLLRAIHEWCTENGYTPHIAVFVDELVQVPHDYVENSSIVLNIDYEATDALVIDNEFVSFNARFNGKVQSILVPITHVMTVFSSETRDGIVLHAEIPQKIVKKDTKAEKLEKKAPILKVIK